MRRTSLIGTVAAVPFALAVGGALAPAAQAATAPSAGSDSTSRAAASAKGQVTIVQAIPGGTVGVAIDGRSVQKDASAGSVLGPYTLAPGEHEVAFSNVQGGTMSQPVSVTAGSSRDVVLHLPESTQGRAVVNTYRTPERAIGADKSRILMAHTANIGPADVSFDGTVIVDGFTNGQFAQADVPAGKHEVQVFPAGDDAKPVLGPTALSLPSRTVTMTYAYGDPQDESMNVVSHTSRLAPATGSTAPSTIHTGSAGLAGVVPTAFGVPDGPQSTVQAWSIWASWMIALPTLALLGLWMVRRTRTNGFDGLTLPRATRF